MSTFGISQNFRATSIIGRFGRTVVPEKVIEKVIVEDHDDEDEDEEDEDDDEDEDEDDETSKKAKALKDKAKAKASFDKIMAAKVAAAKVEAAKKSVERVSSATQFASLMNRYAEKTADHH